MNIRTQKLLNLMFNEAAAPGEILNCVNALRSQFSKGNLFKAETINNADKQEIIRLRYALQESKQALFNAERRFDMVESELNSANKRIGALRDEVYKSEQDLIQTKEDRLEDRFDLGEVICVSVVAMLLGVVTTLLFA